MKLAYAIFAILILIPPMFTQTLVERIYLMRADTTTVHPYMGVTHICILLYPDGRYRLEKSFQGMQGDQGETKIYLDTLSDSDMKSIQSVLDDAKFQEIKTGPPRGGIVNNMDTLDVSIPREHSLQSFSFMNAAQRKPFENALKPFLNSLKTIEKRKVPVAKSETPNNCEAPRVMYRTTFSSGAMPSEPDQH